MRTSFHSPSWARSAPPSCWCSPRRYSFDDSRSFRPKPPAVHAAFVVDPPSMQRAAQRLHCSGREELPWQRNLIGIWMLSVAVGEKRIRARSRSGTPSEVSDRRGKGPSSSAPSWGHKEFVDSGALMPGVVGSRDDIELKSERFERDRSKCERFERRLGQCNPGGVLGSGPRLRLASPTPEPATRPSGGYRDHRGLGCLLGMVLVLSLKHRVAPGVACGRRAALADGRERPDVGLSRLQDAGNHTVAPIMPRIVSEC
jgi:hypothetical protein